MQENKTKQIKYTCGSYLFHDPLINEFSPMLETIQLQWFSQCVLAQQNQHNPIQHKPKIYKKYFE